MFAMNKEQLEPYRVAPGLDLFVVPRFAQDVLGIADPKALLGELERYPSVGADEHIVPNAVQWVTGDNRALKYRGNVLKRGKIWLQRGDPAQHGYLRYGYTGWQWNILPATADVARCKEVEPIANAYDAWAGKLGAKPANHFIVTKYKDGEHSIGYHFDKPQDIAASDAAGLSLITVVKIGECARPFAVREVAPKGEKERAPFFCKALEPGTAVIMSLEANLLTQHAVPPVAEAGPSGSIVFRTIATRIDERAAAMELRKRRRE
jgi:hypothetical protein